LTTNQPVRNNNLTISDDLFTKGYPAGKGPCSCNSTCCAGGVYADVREREIILQHKETIKKYLDETQIADELQWFEGREFDDPDFASGRCVGTREHNDKCVFLDKTGRCSLQVAAAQEGMHKWAIKPLFCILYPIEISNHVVGFDDMLQDDESCCTVNSTFDVPVFEACKEELVHLLGTEGFVHMQERYARMKSSTPTAPVEAR